MVTEADCIFCKLVRNEMPSKKIYEDEDTVAFLDINPTTPGHTLVIPKKHYENIYDIDEKTLCKTMGIVKAVSERVKTRMNAEGINVLQSNSRAAGQLVDHIHFHIIPRYKDDPFIIRFSRIQLSESEMSSIRDKLKEEPQKPAGSDKPRWI
jgi:histidine triad (HIT) family protein